jgi:hypothetical protein
MPSKKHIKYLKNEKNQKFIWDAYPMEFAGSTQNHKKIIGTSTKIKTKNASKNYVSYLNSGREPKICIGATQRNLQAQPIILKKLSEHQINQSDRKFSLKKMFSN